MQIAKLKGGEKGNAPEVRFLTSVSNGSLYGRVF
jgi:hypothetical protein